MDNIFLSQFEKLEALLPIIKIANSQEITALTKFLVERMKNPESFIVFLGETSSGKSSIINGLIGKSILPVSAKPTTGTITEIMFANECNKESYSYLDRSATLRELSKEAFIKYSWQPPSDLSRLRLTIPAHSEFKGGVRLFDTPGYNSIVDAHEEVLKEFLPNSDVIVYTVGYKIGIQNEDFVFLRYLRELLNRDIPVILVVNRCPESISETNRRIVEIKKYARDILGFEPKLFITPQVRLTDPTAIALPKSPGLWEYIVNNLSSKKRVKELQETFDSFIQELFEKCNQVIKMRLAKAKMSADEFNELKNAQIEYSRHIRQAIPELIEPTFNKIIDAIPRKIDETRREVTAIVECHINESDTCDMEEEVGFINTHLLPFNIRKSGKEIIQDYIHMELDALNEKVDDYIQKETIKFNNRVAIALNTNLDVATKGIVKKILAEAGGKGLVNYAVQFGGAGGANAGIANAASHLLKKMGDLIGKTFSRNTHNALKHTLAKIGATSVKRLGGAIAVLSELAMMTYDLTTWKGKARKKVQKALTEWEKDTQPIIISDLQQLKKENIKQIMDISDQYAQAFDDETPANLNELPQLQRDSDMADQWEREYGLKN